MRSSPHRATIAKLNADGHRVCDIVGRLDIGQSYVQKVVKQFKTKGHVQEYQKTGRPRTVNTRRKRGIVKKMITRNDAVSMYKMAEFLGNQSQKSSNDCQTGSGSQELSPLS